MECRENCGICCIIAGIKEPYPGMPNGRPAGTPCVHLSEDFKCKVYNTSAKPKACTDFKAEKEFCGEDREAAIRILASLENLDPNNYLGNI